MASMHAANIGAVAKVEPFNGRNVDAWIAKLEILLLHDGILPERWTLELLVLLSADVFQIVQEAGYTINSSYHEIKAYLTARFGEKKDRYVAQRELVDCVQREGQTITEFAEEIRRKTRLAHSNIPENAKEEIAKNQFIHGLSNSETKRTLLVKDFESFDLVYQFAERLEFAASKFNTRAENGRNEVLAMDSQNIIQRLIDRLDELEKTLVKKKKTLRCFKCGQKGHIKNNCKLYESSGFKYVDFLFLHCHINGKDIRALIDTGAQVSLVSLSFVNKSGIPLLRAKDELPLVAATGNRLNIKGTIDVSLQYNGKECRQKLLVVENLIHDCIIGLNILKVWNFELIIDSERISNNVEKPIIAPVIGNCGIKSMTRKVAVVHKIDTNNTKPIKDFKRRIPYHKRKQMNEIISSMLERGIIEESNSDWAFNSVLVPKKNGKWRLCVDYRRLNAVTVKDSYPLPRIDDVMDTLGNANVFTVLDLKDGYHHIPIDIKDKQKTAFYGVDGLYQFVKMPFGLCNAPATFQRMINLILKECIGVCCLVYLDDIIIFSKDLETNKNDVRKIVTLLELYNLKINNEKSVYYKSEVTFLGHVINADGIKPDKNKVKAIKNWPTPTKIVELQCFLGLLNYYRRFIDKFSQISNPLCRLLRNDVPWNWSPECQKSFDMLKKKLMECVLLAHPNWNESFILDTDASNQSIGAVLSQVIDGEERVVAFASRSLLDRERNYSVTRKELLALVHFINHFKFYLHGKKFLARTDHHALKWLLSFKKPEGQVARWLEHLSQYEFDVVYREGKMHGNADALSRVPEITQALALSIQGLSNDVIINRQRNDAILNKIIGWIESNRMPKKVPKELDKRIQTLWLLRKCLRLDNSILCREFVDPKTKEVTLRVVIPESLKSMILELAHDNVTSGHLGHEKVAQNIRRNYYWPLQNVDIKNWCQSCEICARRNRPTRKFVSEMDTSVSSYPMERIAIDMVGPLPTTYKGNRFICVVQDYFTKWGEAIPMKDQEAHTVVRKLTGAVFSKFGLPSVIHTDQGTNFESKLFQNMCKMFGISKTRTCAFNPKSDGMVERLNRTLIDMVSKLVHKDNEWDTLLPTVMMAYRSSTHSSTGYSPNYLMLGREVRTPLETISQLNAHNYSHDDYVKCIGTDLRLAKQIALDNLKANLGRTKTAYNKKAYGKPYNPGEKVWLVINNRQSKLEPYYKGPYVVKEKLSDSVYRLEGQGKVLVTNFDKLKPFIQRRLIEDNFEEDAMLPR